MIYASSILTYGYLCKDVIMLVAKTLKELVT